MYTIKNKPKCPKIVWDKEKGQPLLTFKGGCFETVDSGIAKKAKALGYEVIEDDAESDTKKPAGKGKKKENTENAGQDDDAETKKTAE